MTVSGKSGLNADFHTIMGICERVKSGEVSFVKANKALAQMGHTTETALSESFSQIANVNKNLGASNITGAVGIGAASAGSAMAGRDGLCQSHK